MQTLSLTIHRIEKHEISTLWSLIEKLGHAQDNDYFEQCFDRQEKGDLDVLLGYLDQEPVTYCLYNRQPKYGYFKVCGLPEIQDLNVLRDYRKRGIGRAMIEYCENLARKEGYTEMGIGVGLDASYGPAQRLYVKMGYIPDGQGINYDRKQVTYGEFRPVDDLLCLMMTKKLS